MGWRGWGEIEKRGYDRGVFNGEAFLTLVDNFAVNDVSPLGSDLKDFRILGGFVGKVF